MKCICFVIFFIISIVISADKLVEKIPEKLMGFFYCKMSKMNLRVFLVFALLSIVQCKEDSISNRENRLAAGGPRIVILVRVYKLFFLNDHFYT